MWWWGVVLFHPVKYDGLALGSAGGAFCGMKYWPPEINICNISKTYVYMNGIIVAQ